MNSSTDEQTKRRDARVRYMRYGYSRVIKTTVETIFHPLVVAVSNASLATLFTPLHPHAAIHASPENDDSIKLVAFLANC
jgi:hypothetical protein